MDEEELIDSVILLYDVDPVLRPPLIAYVRRRARKLDIASIIDDMIVQYDEAQKKEDTKYTKAIRRGNAPVEIERDANGRALTTIGNFLGIMTGDPFFGDVRYNMLSGAPETMTDGELRRWTDEDDAKARGYIESVYRIHNQAKYKDAVRQLFGRRAYHPIHDIIEAIEWDGTNRIEHFLHKWVQCEDTPYTRECSRLIFAGGIHRVYNPGCKFDDMVVLIGIKQGEGKSTLVRWLAMEDRFFREVTEFDGQKGMEALDGAWICEVGELLALTKTKEQEAVKSYLTRQTDSYRRPYGERVDDYPRQCVFVGTTNKREFLADMTGGRRFYPVTVNMSGYDLYDNKEAIQHEIAQCWAEALHRMRDEADGMPAYADRGLIAEIRAIQSSAQKDDYRVGMIERYLDGREQVCGIELWEEALKQRDRTPTPKDFTDISTIMQGFDSWERFSGRVRTKYGRQRVWIRKQETINGESFLVVDEQNQSDLPFSGWKTQI